MTVTAVEITVNSAQRARYQKTQYKLIGGSARTGFGFKVLLGNTELLKFSEQS